MPKNKRFVSAIIPCRNEIKFITRMIDNLTLQELSDIDLEIIVADGMSSDGTRDALQELQNKYPNLMLVNNPSKFIPNGLNRALVKAKGEIIVRLDVHTSYAKDYISRCVDTLIRTRAKNVGGPWRASGHGYWGKAIADVFQFSPVFGGVKNRALDYEGPVDSVYLGCWWKRDLIEAGGFDRYSVRNEDNELNRRLRKKGGVIWQSPLIRSEYEVPQELKKFARQWLQNGYWGVYTIRKHTGLISLRHRFFISLVALSLACFISFVWLGRPFFFLMCGAILYTVFDVMLSFLLVMRTGCLSSFPLYFITILFTHFSWSAGFVLGLLDFFLISRKGVFKKSFSKLVR